MRATIRRLLLARALSAWDVFLPINRVWWVVCGVPLLAVLHWLVGFLAAYPVTLAIGPFGLAVIATTLLVRVVLLPLTVYQVRASLRARREEAGLGAGLRTGLLPVLVQAPLLIALYSVILAFAHTSRDLHFLWLANLAVPDPVLLPVLAGLGTYLLTRLTNAAQPPPPEDDEQTAATRRAVALLSPLGLVIAAHFAPAALVLYWLTGSVAGAAQQWAVNRFVLRWSASTT